MALAGPGAAVCLALSIGVAIFAVLLASWLWHERQGRDRDLSAADASHFARQDVRRAMVVLIFLALALGLYLGAKVPPRVAGRTNFHFLRLWFGILVLILALPVLALFDWLATRFYARRHVRELARERLEILREELRQRASRASDRNGSGGPIGDPHDRGPMTGEG